MPFELALLRALLDDLLEAGESAADDEEYVARIHLQKFLLGMLPAALGRH